MSTKIRKKYGHHAYTLVLLRHGQSTWNLENRFTGWTDVGLTAQGENEAHDGWKALLRGRLHL